MSSRWAAQSSRSQHEELDPKEPPRANRHQAPRSHGERLAEHHIGHDRCTSRVVKSQCISEGTEHVAGCVAKSFSELCNQFGTAGATKRAGIYKSFADRMLVEAGHDGNSPENRWYWVPQASDNLVWKTERKLQKSDSNPEVGEAARSIELEAVRHCVGEEQAKELELQPPETSHPGPASRAPRKATPPVDASVGQMRAKLRAAAVAHSNLGKRLYNLKHRLSQTKMSEFALLVESMEQELDKQGRLQQRGRHQSAGEQEIKELNEHSEKLKALLSAGK